VLIEKFDARWILADQKKENKRQEKDMVRKTAPWKGVEKEKIITKAWWQEKRQLSSENAVLNIPSSAA